MSAGRAGHNSSFQGQRNRGAYHPGPPMQPRLAAVPVPFDPYAVSLQPVGPYDQPYVFGAQGYSGLYNMPSSHYSQVPIQHQNPYIAQAYNSPMNMFPTQMPHAHASFQDVSAFGSMPTQQFSSYRGRTYSGSRRGGRGGGVGGRRGHNDYAQASQGESKEFHGDSHADQTLEDLEKNEHNTSGISGSVQSGPKDKAAMQGTRGNSSVQGARSNVAAAESTRTYYNYDRGPNVDQSQQDDSGREDVRYKYAYKDSFYKPSKSRNRNDTSYQALRDNQLENQGRDAGSDRSSFGKRGQNDTVKRGKNFKENRGRYEEENSEEIGNWNKSNQNGPNSQKANLKKSLRKPQTEVSVDLNQDNQRERMIDMLRGNHYECMVCCDTVLHRHAIWACEKCFHIFHIGCIKKWARTSLEQDQDTWRCPSCQNEIMAVPSRCFCFCGKERDPESNRWDIPHSCGEPCGKQRGVGCPHRCPIMCHPGPCPPCSAMTDRFCYCGKISIKVRCGQSDIPSCNQECGSLRKCGRHVCREVCHPPPCASCSIMFSQACYGEHTKREVQCGSEEDKEESYCCHQTCDKMLACGQHRCQEECHVGPCGTCTRLPGVSDSCCCGRKKLSELDLPSRQSCLDPLPICDQPCGKLTGCGPSNNPHICPLSCHEGPCGPCGEDKVTPISCRCDSEVMEVPCAEAKKLTDDPPRCKRRCNKKLNCRRHKCLDDCCTLTDHICERACGRKLNCGIHRCAELCHNQPCKPCEETSFDEIACLCGNTVLMPPVYCGMRLPECPFLCTRTHACDHPVRHKCHTEDNCPPCVELIERLCAGNHEVRKNIPCYLKEVLCGKFCGKPLSCGFHTCLRSCHSGPCQAEGFVCKQPCKEKRGVCGHPCNSPCHPNSPCPDNICTSLVEVRCPCGRRVERVPCGAGSSSRTDNAELQRIVMQSLSMGASVDLTQINQARRNRTQELECDADCHVLERNRRFAEALKISTDGLPKLGPPNYSPFLKDYARTNPTVVSKIETKLSELVKSVQEGRSVRSHTFRPMNRDSRRCIHELAEIYRCESQSFDVEPQRNVVVTAKRSNCNLPAVALMELMEKPKAPPPVPHSRRLLTSGDQSSSSGWMQLYSSASKNSAAATSATSASASSGTNTTGDAKSSANRMDEIDYFDYDK